jgi:glycosyltransferase involved in cell wall biosynthesis
MTTLTVSMIVRDAQAHLPACLASVKPLAAEIVIADTGSVDGTVAIAEEFGARVIHIPWKNDFAEARNCALAEAHGEWILSLDADEQLDATAAGALPAMLGNKNSAGYQVVIRNYVNSPNERIWDQAPKLNDCLLPSASAYPAFVEHQNVRLFRRSPEVYFVGRVHESVGPRIEAIGGVLSQANFVIHHFGLAVDETTKARKNHMYREMGRQKIQEFPKDWQAFFELGLLELEQYKNLPEARTLFSRACDLNPSAGVAWFFLGLSIFRMGYFEDALNFLRQAEHAGHRTALVAETRGDAHYNLGDFEQARTSYEAAWKRQDGSPALLAKLCLATVRAGKTEKGLSRLQAALAATPQIAELHEGLILALVFLNRIEQAAQAADEKLRSIPGLYPADYIRCASLWAQLRNWPRAVRALEQGLRAYPGRAELTRAMQEVCQAAGASKEHVPQYK